MGNRFTRALVADRFWSKVQKTEACWMWTGARDARGYGRMTAGRGVNLKAHRVSWELQNGQIPAGLSVLHRCDNPPCVRVDHLFLGTSADNSRDAAQKGRLVFQQHPDRAPRGERASSAKLTRAQVEEIRRAYAAGGSTQTALARQFGVTQAAIWNVVTGKTWKELQHE